MISIITIALPNDYKREPTNKPFFIIMSYMTIPLYNERNGRVKDGV